MKVTLTPEVLDVLERSTITSTSVKLPSSPRLEPKLYQKVNKVLEAAGGKWSKKEQAHVFPTDPRAELGLAQKSGVIIDKAKARKKARQAFYTPEAAARTLAGLADFAGHYVLEPSAGHGALAYACIKEGASCVDCFEIDQDACDSLTRDGYTVLATCDFLETSPEEPSQRYQRIVMNPPFTRKADAKHVLHAFDHWLALGGILTAIVADDGKDRPDLAAGAPFQIIHHLPAGTFKESGTMIATLVIQLSK